MKRGLCFRFKGPAKDSASEKIFSYHGGSVAGGKKKYTLERKGGLCYDLWIYEVYLEVGKGEDDDI